MSAPVTTQDFAAAMAQLGPFEPRPLLAVAVSGGADSMALAVLTQDWVRRRRGQLLALTVDHGLRAESRREAALVGRRMRRRGIAHRILSWQGAKPATGMQSAARVARYGLLAEACRRAGALHLLLGHTSDDQAETVLLRLAAGSGPLGLAAMAPLQETAPLRLLRPLLAMPRPRLAATLEARGEDWIEDPSNRDDRYARIRIRRALAAQGESVGAKLAAAAAELGRFRAGTEAEIASVLARSVILHPEGFARLDLDAWHATPPEIGRRALAALLATVGGLDHLPGTDPVRRLHDEIGQGGLGAGRTLARCRVLPAGPGACLILRELRQVERLRPRSRVVHWDRRFTLCFAAAPGPDLEVGPLGPEGWAEAVTLDPALRETRLPYPVRLSLPAIRDGKGVAAIPTLCYRRPGGRKITAIAHFRPVRPLVPAFFAAAGGP